MRINGSIPFHIAQAYGVARAKPVAHPAAIGAPSPLAKIAPGANVRTVDAAADLSSISGIARPRHIDRIVGATVHRPISFDGAATPMSNGSPLQLYTRAADKIDAAIAVNVGRALDVTG